MQPSVSVTLEPGLEQGVPWGRDLYTFVTSAAGHMMRTLQKPRKNRPSKRQVNHRRFLYNMIQRKFADIEAANCRLASALYLKEAGSSTPEQSCDQPDGCKGQHDNQKVQSGTKKINDTSSTCPIDEVLHTHHDEDDMPISRSFTPQFSPLSFEAMQLFVDGPGDSNKLADVTESDWADIMNLFSEDDEAERHTDRFPETAERNCGRDCHGDHRPIISHLHTDNDFVLPDPLPVLSSCQHKMSSSGGVAQSFWAPPHNASLGHIVTPPHEDHLMFTDILMDIESPACTSFNMLWYQDVCAQ
ncbi:uncharacterized protein LOC133401495 [Phycodurus eques]|uniref:uncharacterized protein LOC133401495 n=1 Tax=Phycodurus eques TaxID=693459 RepID=UPI002ACD9B22|nr:uncharacterized protein LOC133401495 [Phycodurus eques]